MIAGRVTSGPTLLFWRRAENPLSSLLGMMGAATILAAVLLMALYSAHDGGIRVFTVGVLVALGSSGVSAVAGFLFGLPRYSSVVAVPATKEGVADASSAAPEATAAMRQRLGLFTPSNNLEQVSDWFTKILIGAGLVQLGQVGQWIGRFVNGLAPAFTGEVEVVPASARTVAGAVLALSVTAGFVFGYLVTTLWYQRRVSSA